MTNLLSLIALFAALTQAAEPNWRAGVVAYGFNPMVIDAATVATMHSDEERVPVAEFLTGIHIFHDILMADF